MLLLGEGGLEVGEEGEFGGRRSAEGTEGLRGCSAAGVEAGEERVDKVPRGGWAYAAEGGDHPRDEGCAGCCAAGGVLGYL